MAIQQKRVKRPPAVKLTVLASSVSAVLASAYTSEAQAQGEALEQITVTGSRIVRRDLTAASPIVTVETERFERSSTLSMEGVLNQMPQFVPEGTQFDQGIQASPTLSLGIGSLNLRGIGPNRTLVLVDGRRAQPANATLIVDVNTIPAAAIERVETITGGASAVYGADALAGVVNFILKDDFEGVEMDFHTGTTAEGDGEESRFTALLGVNSDDNNVMLGVEWYNRGEVMQRDREFYRNGWFDPQSDAPGFIHPSGYSPVFGGGLPTQAAVDTIFAGVPGYFPCAGAVDVDGDGETFDDCTPGAGQFKVPNSSEIYFNADGSPFVLAGARGYNGPFASPDNLGTPGDGFSGMRLQPNGNLGQVSFNGQASTPLERRSAFGRARVGISDNMSAFVQANYSSVEVETTGGFPPAITVWSAPIPRDGRAIPAALDALLQSRTTPDADWTLFRVLDYLGTPVEPVSSTDAWQIMAGVEGSFINRDWTWEAYVSSGETDTTNFFNNLPSLQRYQFLVAGENFGVGEFTQGRNYTISCSTGLPVFDSFAVDPNCIEGIDSKGRSITSVGQNIAEFNLQGKVADMRAGELRFAAGASARENTFQYDPGETNDNVSTIENPIGIFASNNTKGSTEVSEIYGELLIPATESLEFELGYRRSDYDSAAGTVNTYKSLFSWDAANTVTLRGGYQEAERAANTAELFQGTSLLVVPFGPSDPCSFTTQAPWGNVGDNTIWDFLSPNPDRLQVQQLCLDLINESDSDPTNDNPANYVVGGTANDFARPGNPFFPLEIELRQGNENVKSERGKTWTIGAVFQSPGGLENVTASVDYYNIEITDAIAPLSSLYVYQQCFNANGTSNPTYSIDDPGGFCRMIQRFPGTSERSSVDAPFVNIGVLETSGLDLTVNWVTDVGPGSLFVNSLVTILNSYDIQDAADSPVVDARDTLAEGGQFKYKVTSALGYEFGGGNASVGLQWRHLPSIRDESAARNPATTVFPVDSYNLFNLFASYTFNDRMSMRMGIDNLFDEDPLIVGSRPGDRNAENTRPDYYDILGRRAYVGLKVEF